MSSGEYLKLTYLDENITVNQQNVINHETRVLPFGNSKVFFAPIQSSEKLTKGDDVKTVFRLTLNIEGINNDFNPGDTIGIIPSNDQSLVYALLVRLNISNADTPCKVEIFENTTKKNPIVPKHLPNCVTTIKNIFLYNVDIQTVPKKLFLKALSRFSSNPSESETLQHISSPKGSKEYNELINNNGKTLLGLLQEFPSCIPPISVLLEHLPPLQPRPYSVSSSPLKKNELDLTFFVMEKNDGRKGVCTSWLQHLINEESNNKSVPFYFRQPNHFQLPQDPKIPLILISTGTGISPFRGFLQHRSIQLEDNQIKMKENKIWLIFGCRYSTRDYLYKNELENYVKNGVLTRLDVAFSRDQNEKIYVQNKLNQSSEDLVNWIVGEGKTMVFVCGDGKTMVKDIEACLINNFAKFGHENYFKELQDTKRYIVDSWM